MTQDFTKMTDRELSDWVYNANKKAQLIPDEYATEFIYSIEYYQEAGDTDYQRVRTTLEELASTISNVTSK